MQTFETDVVGLTPLLIHRFLGEPETASRTILQDHGTPREQAEKTVYRHPDGTFYFLGAAISRMVREAGGGHKMKGSRKALKWIIPAALIVPDDTITILEPGTMAPVADFEVDSRPVTIPATKGRIMRHRARFDEWAARITMEIEPSVLPAAMIHQLLAEGGMRIGIGDYRPEKGGPFGRFRVVRWAEIESALAEAAD